MGVSYDFVPESKVTVDGDLFDGKRTRVRGDVQFSGLNLGGGLSFTW